MRKFLAPVVPALVPFLGLTLASHRPDRGLATPGCWASCSGCSWSSSAARCCCWPTMTKGMVSPGWRRRPRPATPRSCRRSSRDQPIYAPAAQSATVLIAASIVVTAILCPVVTVIACAAAVLTARRRKPGNRARPGLTCTSTWTTYPPAPAACLGGGARQVIVRTRRPDRRSSDAEAHQSGRLTAATVTSEQGIKGVTPAEPAESELLTGHHRPRLPGGEADADA